jgi:xylan 1,4-beta-xylosidase
MNRTLLSALCGLSISLFLLPSLRAEDLPAPIAVRIEIDAARPRGDLRPIWRYFGYDEPNFTYMKDGKKLLAELGQLGPHKVHIRTHHLLTSGDGTPALKWGSTNVYTEDAEGRPIYDWTIVDRIFDTYLERGLRPLVEIGFMPEALSTHPQDYPHNPPPDKLTSISAGQAYPPKDYAKWGELCFQWARHCVEKYGKAEVEQWPWEVWNEPNIGYWKGRPEDYYKLYDFAVAGVRRAVPGACVGGPHTAGGPGGNFLKDFLEHCLHGVNSATGEKGSPLDFVAFHAKGSPKFENDHVQMGLSAQLRNIDAGFATVASFPELKNTPIIIGESDPEGCAACRGRQLGYRNGTMYSSYTAASFARKYALADKRGVNFEGALTWAFEFENQPYFAGFRVLASNGIDLPVLNVFRMFGKMGGRRLTVTSSADAGVESILTKGVRDAADISALASLDGNRLCLFAWHYHDDDVAGPAAAVELSLTGLPVAARAAKLRHYRIDFEHSNAFEAWKRMGSPATPSPEQYRELETAGQLAEVHDPQTVSFKEGASRLALTLPRQAVALLVLEW